MSDHYYPPYPCCGGYSVHDGRPACDDYRNPPPQPLPRPSPGPAVWDLVMADMRQRDAVGAARYGQRLVAHDGRDSVRDAYEEALDLACYLRKVLLERDGR